MREARMPANTLTALGGDRRRVEHTVVEIDASASARRCAGIELARVTRALAALHALRAMTRSLWTNDDAARDSRRVEPFGGAAPHAGVVALVAGAASPAPVVRSPALGTEA